MLDDWDVSRLAVERNEARDVLEGLQGVCDYAYFSPTEANRVETALFIVESSH